MHTDKHVERELLDTLARLGGGITSDDDIEFAGTKVVIPEKMTIGDTIDFLHARMQADEDVNEFSRTFDFRPWDGARAVKKALKQVVGAVVGKATFSFFGKNPPQQMTIATGVNDTEQVPWGAIEVPLVKGTMHLGARPDPEKGLLFVVTIEAPRKYRYQVEGIFRLIDETLRSDSLYRGQAITGGDNPEFVDLAGVDPAKVVYNGDVERQIDANIWALLKHTQAMRDNSIPLKRAVLLEGPYGTGKTLAAFLTAKIAVENGWTFIYNRPGKDDLKQTLATARLYQPAVVFYEDVDTLTERHNDADGVSVLLDAFDGIQAKGTELMVVMTTNHADRIHKGMVRPGRLDAVVHVGALDNVGCVELINSVIPAHLLDESIDWDAVAVAMEGFLPAFVREAIDRAIRYNIAYNGGTPKPLSTADFVDAANGLRPQLALMEDAPEHEGADDVTTVLRKTIVDALDGKVRLDRGNELTLTRVTE